MDENILQAVKDATISAVNHGGECGSAGRV